MAKTLEGYNTDIKTLNYFQHTWRPSTKKNYVVHVNRWALWAPEKGISVLNPQIADVLKYLRIYFETGVVYGAVNELPQPGHPNHVMIAFGVWRRC